MRKTTKNMTLAAMFMALGLVLPFSDRSDPADRKHVASDAHSGLPMRIDLRLAVRRGDRLCAAASALRAVWDAGSVPDRDSDVV